jgi:hypothetical protein
MSVGQQRGGWYNSREVNSRQAGKIRQCKKKNRKKRQVQKIVLFFFTKCQVLTEIDHCVKLNGGQGSVLRQVPTPSYLLPLADARSALRAAPLREKARLAWSMRAFVSGCGCETGTGSFASFGTVLLLRLSGWLPV